MKVIPSREAQLKFGNFSRVAQKEVSIVTSYGHPIFLTVPVKITASIAEIIQTLNPVTHEETANKLEFFFHTLVFEQANQVAMSDQERADFIKNAL